nr:hypothetical protein [Bradyrhizobium sp. NBAIM03]
MPTQIRTAVEEAVARGDIDYLVCTTTLLQGVNLSAKNLFLCRPQKGDNVPLESVDFWNLVGRAGRLMKEFQGNIFLIDYDNWRKKPLEQPRVHYGCAGNRGRHPPKRFRTLARRQTTREPADRD